MTTPQSGSGIGFLGGGHMARALVGALRRRGVAGDALHVCEPVVERAASLQRDFGVTLHEQAAHCIEAIETLVLAVKPQDLAAALVPLSEALGHRRPLVISIAAGVPTSRLRQWCAGAPVIRAMPNRPAMVGVGATGLYAGPEISAELRLKAAALLGAAGEVVWIDDETLMDVVTALSGSGPAYFYALAEALGRAGEAAGLPPAVSRTLARATLHGSGALAQAELTADLATLRESVTSKGGTTAAALEVFRRGNLESLVQDALEAAVRRGRELGG